MTVHGDEEPLSDRAQQPIKAHLVLTTGVFGSKFSGSNAANSDSTSMVTIPMLSEAVCKAEGERWLRRRSRFRKGFREYFCVILRWIMDAGFFGSISRVIPSPGNPS